MAKRIYDVEVRMATTSTIAGLVAIQASSAQEALAIATSWDQNKLVSRVRQASMTPAEDEHITAAQPVHAEPLMVADDQPNEVWDS